MKKRFSFQNIKIKYQLFSLVAVSMVILITVQLVYYHKFSAEIKAATQVSASNLLVQLEENLSIQADSIIQTAETIAYNEYVQEFMGSSNYMLRASYIKFIRNLFDNFMITNPNISDIILADDLGQIVRHASSPDWDTIHYILDAFPVDTQTRNGPGGFYLIDSGQTSLYLYAFAFTSYRDLQKTEICYILFQNDSFQRIINNTELPDSTMFYLLDQNNRILASRDDYPSGAYASEELMNLTLSEQKQSITDYQGERCLVTHSTIPEMSWTLVSIIDLEELEKPLVPLRTFGLVFGIIMLLVLLFLCIIIIRNIARPLGELSAFLSDVNYQTLKRRMDSTGSNEIDQVIQKINTMMEQIQELTHRIFTTQQQFYEMELSKRQAEFYALQNQINPHFLYNTLDCIRSIAFSYHADEIVSISSSMSKIFRYCIKGPNTVLVKDELDCIKNYMNIIQIRYDNRFQIEWEIDPSLPDLSMIKFVLQPVIENAVSHGLELKLGPGTLRINGSWVSDTDFSFEIYDTGAGISAEKLSQLNTCLNDPALVSDSDDTKHTGIGLYNINKRIKSVYGNEYGITIDSVEGEWTLVKILLRGQVNL